jgi:hypothetical protein
MHKRLIIITAFLLSMIFTTLNIHAQSNKLRAGEFLIDTNVVYVLAADNQSHPSIASDDTTAFVVWDDRRNGTFDIYGSRVDEDGNILDPAGIFIADAGSFESYPDVAFDGTNYLVVWCYNDGSNPTDIYGARVSKQGNLLDNEPFIISDAAGDQSMPAVAFDGTNYLVVWYDGRSGSSYDIYCTRVAQNGTVLNTAGIAISTATGDQLDPDVSFDGNNYMVVWQDERSDTLDIYASRVAQNGVPLDFAGIKISGATDEQSSPSIDFDGTNYFVAWTDHRTGSEYDIYGTRIDTGGAVLNPAGIAISTATNQQRIPSVSFGGIYYLVTWYDRRDGSDYDIYGARINQSGVVQETSGINILTINAAQYLPAVTSYSGQWLVAWYDNRNGSNDIYGSRINASGTVMDASGFPISFSAQTQGKPAVASDGTNYLVVWHETEDDGNSTDIYGMRIDASGNQLDPDAIAISTVSGSQEYPAVAFDNDSIYLVVWHDDRSGSNKDIYGCRVSTSGNALDLPGIAISTATSDQEYPSVAFDGTNFLVVWDDGRVSSLNEDIYGTLVEPDDGNVVTPAGNVIADDEHWQRNPVVAFDGTNYLVVWYDYGGGTFDEDIYGVRVNQSGNPIDGSSIAISTAANGQYFPAVAFDGNNYLIAWEDKRNSNVYDIYGTRVNQSGTVLDASGISILQVPGIQHLPFIAFDGGNYLVGCEHQTDSAIGILSAVVNTSGTVIDTLTITSFTQRWYNASPTAANGPGTQILIVFPEWADYINGNPANSIRIWGKIRLAAGVEEEDKITALNGKFDLKAQPITQEICQLTFVHSTPTPVKLKLFNTAGILLNERIVGNKAGYYDLNLDMSNLPNGTYFLSISSGNLKESEKVVLIK